MDDQARRQMIGDRLISGVGYEIGPGTLPSQYAGIVSVTYLDKRNRAELESYFKVSVPYDVRDINDGTALPPSDFVIAHHVVEHAPDTIGTIAHWASLIRDGGMMFLSLPASDHPCERQRPPTPFEHILHDHLFKRGEDSFDSKQHIPHFINQWTAMSLDSFWYAKGDISQYVATSLSEVQRSGHDLHWHTYTLDVMRDTITAGFWFAGHGVDFLHAEHSDGLLYIVARKSGRTTDMPGFLREHHDRLLSAAHAMYHAAEPRY